MRSLRCLCFRFGRLSLLLSALSLPAATVCAQVLDSSALGRARQWITGNDPEKIRSVIRSFQDITDPSALEQYRQLLIEGKRANEARIDAELSAGPDRPAAADARLEALWAARLRTRGMVPLDPGALFQPSAFRTALAETAKLDAECAALFSRPEAAAAYAKLPAAERVESLRQIDAELARFFPDAGLWLGIHPLLGNFRGAALLERHARARAYLAECATRPAAREALQPALTGQPDAISATFREIASGRSALGLPPLRPDSGLSEILAEWVRREFAAGPLPDQAHPEAESQLEALATARNIRSWIRHVVILPGALPAKTSLPPILQHGPTVRAVFDPQTGSFGFHHSPRGLVMVLAEAAGDP